jgi:hypothetical protein
VYVDEETQECRYGGVAAGVGILFVIFAIVVEIVSYSVFEYTAIEYAQLNGEMIDQAWGAETSGLLDEDGTYGTPGPNGTRMIYRGNSVTRKVGYAISKVVDSVVVSFWRLIRQATPALSANMPVWGRRQAPV